jgi:chitin synthase
MILLCVVWSLHGQEWTKQAHYLSYIFSFYTFLLMFLVLYNVVQVYIGVGFLQSFAQIFDDSETALVFIITCLNILVYILIIIVNFFTHFKFLWRMFVDVISYLAYNGAYSHVMLIYAFCNVDNVSWGTKGNKGARVQAYLI